MDIFVGTMGFMGGTGVALMSAGGAFFCIIMPILLSLGMFEDPWAKPKTDEM